MEGGDVGTVGREYWGYQGERADFAEEVGCCSCEAVGDVETAEPL